MKEGEVSAQGGCVMVTSSGGQTPTVPLQRPTETGPGEDFQDASPALLVLISLLL